MASNSTVRNRGPNRSGDGPSSTSGSASGSGSSATSTSNANSGATQRTRPHNSRQEKEKIEVPPLALLFSLCCTSTYYVVRPFLPPPPLFPTLLASFGFAMWAGTICSVFIAVVSDNFKLAGLKGRDLLKLNSKDEMYVFFPLCFMGFSLSCFFFFFLIWMGNRN
jgi:hypothetical protein